MKERIFILLIIFLSVSLVHSRGASEQNQMDIAKQLLEEKKYNEAIAVLTSYMSENPAVIYEVQPLLDDIRKQRDANNKDMDELIHVLYDLEDIDRAYELIEEIKRNNPYPDALSKDFINNARENAVFVINKKKFKSYMDEALVLLNNNDFSGALDKYLLCLDFHNDEFDLLVEELNSGELEFTELELSDENTSLASYFMSLKNSSLREVNLIKSQTNRFKQYLVELDRAYNSAIGEIDNRTINIENLRNSLNAFRTVPTYLELYSDRQNQLTSYNNLYQKVSIDGIASKYMSYANLTLKGRKDKEEGFINLIQRLYPFYLDDIISSLEKRIDTDLDRGRILYYQGEYERAKELFSRGIDTSSSLALSSRVWDSFNQFDDELNLVGTKIRNSKYYKRGDSEINDSLHKSYITLSDYLISLYSRDRENEEKLDEYRDLLVFRLNKIESDLVIWTSEETRINQNPERFYKAPLRVSELNAAYNQVKDLYIDREIDTVDRISRIDYVNIFSEDIKEGDGLVDVMAETIVSASVPTNEPENIAVYFGINSTDERNITTYNPETALSDLNRIEADYEAYILSLNNYKTKFENEKEYISATYNFNRRYENVITAINMATDNRELLSKYKSEALDKITLSKEQENRGFALYNQALNAFNRESFKEARELIQDGKNVSEIAVSYSQNRIVIDQLIPSLYNLEDKIIQEEARIVIRDVRRLITRGKTQYLEGAYIPASNLFREAELRWSETNNEAHPEIPYWLALIKDALAIESGRYLSITEPLYNVLAGYLSFAEKYFREGLTKSDEVEKLKYFALADSYLVKILQVKPLNERARFLQLRVLKSKDPEAFKTIFNNDFVRYRNTVIRSIENRQTMTTSQAESLIPSYEAIISDAYLRNPRLSGSQRRKLLERFYKPLNTAGKSQAAIQREKKDIEDKRKDINESYIKFKDLYKIAEGSQKASVKRIMDITEVALGFKRLPVDTSNIRESNRIFIQAKSRFENTNQSEVDKLNSILQDLKRALTLNPGNEDIPVVIDDILVMLGEESNFQLQPREDKLFREAQRDFIDGRYFDARDKIIEILRANSKNKNYPKLKELINRVEVKLKEEITI